MGEGFIVQGVFRYAFTKRAKRLSKWLITTMGLEFPGEWRFTPPNDGRFLNKAMPDGAVAEFIELIEKIRTKRDRWSIFEHFKSAFGAYSTSSTESWAYSDLRNVMEGAAENAPLFIESIYDGCEDLRREGSGYVPDATIMNAILERHNVGYVIQDGELVPRERAAPRIEVPASSPSLSERAREILDSSLQRSEELLRENRSREAVQEILWLLETITTAFRGVATQSGRVEGKYFNRIVLDLRNKHTGTTLERVLDWITTMHGYLSAPAGGAVRHGIDLNAGIDMDSNQARLFCNLTRSYISFLIVEHEVLMRTRR